MGRWRFEYRMESGAARAGKRAWRLLTDDVAGPTPRAVGSFHEAMSLLELGAGYVPALRMVMSTTNEPMELVPFAPYPEGEGLTRHTYEAIAKEPGGFFVLADPDGWVWYHVAGDTP